MARYPLFGRGYNGLIPDSKRSFMQTLIARIVAETGLTSSIAEKGVGILLGLVATQGDKMAVANLFDHLPGAAELAKAHGGDGAAGGGLMGMLAGGMMGGPLAMFAKLQAAGISMEQIKTVAALTLQHAKDTAGPERVRAAAANIPGISGYL
jgi:hypothetical protein